MGSVFGQRENINTSTVFHAGLPPSISALAATLVPTTAIPAVETTVAAAPEPTTATEELPTNVDREVKEVTFGNFNESMERFLEQAAPTPEPQNEEVESIASSGETGSDDDDDNVPRGRKFF
ncbi:hypothetical protein BDB00DRAFT_873446 [Zychaea mexicana]|uniref:uncharacterized protein n=1 Tax=Zychaea mexicana TaxID=64656 RepID=UPI0022FEDFB4|nr:uncharacterized protein BDB00DRAFT_873446 [Zychaea mexicana]KAI9492361.1 hypothetical protein BDB00DRAFT_873446 [Zychaea mexicana]